MGVVHNWMYQQPHGLEHVALDQEHDEAVSHELLLIVTGLVVFTYSCRKLRRILTNQ